MPGTVPHTGCWVDPARPVNWERSINSGLSNHWLIVPNSGWSKGATLRDLPKRNHGALNSGCSWGTNLSRPGGWGRLITDGSTGIVDCGTVANLTGATKASYATWIYRSSTSHTPGLGGSSGGSNHRFSLVWYSDGNVYLPAEAAGSNTYGFVALSGTGWHHIAVVYDGSLSGNSNVLKAWVDGVSQTLSYNGTIPAALGTVNPWRFGTYDNTSTKGQGAYDDCRLYVGKALSEAQVKSIYHQSRLGYPRALAWLPDSGTIETATDAAAATTVAFYRSLLGVGV